MQTRTAAKLMAVAVGLRVLVVVSKALLDRLRGRDNKYDGLLSIVSYSSRLIAAARAVETREQHSLIKDPLAEALAGPKAIERSLQRSQEAPAGSERRNKVGMMAIRTRWFDDQILAALGAAVSAAVPSALLASTPAQRSSSAGAAQSLIAGSSAEAASGVTTPGTAAAAALAVEAVTPEEGHFVFSRHEQGQVASTTPCQVVLLGAGMDSRPWRLALPVGVRWFEVDRQDVLNAKEALLSSLGAELGSASDSSSNNGSRVHAGEMAADGIDVGTNGSLASTAGRGSSSGSSSSQHGYKYPLQASFWAGVACDFCSPGWTRSLQAAGFDPSQPTVWVAEGLLMYLTGQEVEALLREVAGASAPGSLLVAMSVTDNVIEDIKRKGSSSELISTWKFGCPPDPRQFLAEHGWHLELALTRGQMGRRLHLDPSLCTFAFDSGDTTEARSVFFTASVGAA